jgi:hypothetical protein
VLLDAIAASDGSRADVISKLFQTKVNNGYLAPSTSTENGDPSAHRARSVGFTIYKATDKLETRQDDLSEAGGRRPPLAARDRRLADNRRKREGGPSALPLFGLGSRTHVAAAARRREDPPPGRRSRASSRAGHRLARPRLVGLPRVRARLRHLVNDPAEFFNVAFIGLTNGAVYALVALGYTLVYGILQLINFAHGDVFALGGLVASSVIITWFGLGAGSSAGEIVLGIAVALVVSVVFASVLNTGIELVAYRRLRNAPRLAPLITAVGMSFILQDVGLIRYGVDFQSTEKLIPNRDAFSIGGCTSRGTSAACCC